MNHTQLSPFGVEIDAPGGSALAALDLTELRSAIALHRFVLLRGFAPPDEPHMLGFCRQLGEILEREFGAVNELQAKADAKDCLYTSAAVPFRWDGAFAGRVPHYIFFHCRVAPPPDAGGETTFCDTVRVLEHATLRQRELWDRIQITYTSEKVVHYGGSFVSPLIAAHPVSGTEVLRYAEPVEDLDPVRLSIAGLPPEKHAEFVAEMHGLLNDPAVCYAHSWRENDILIADNHALLHGRRAFRADAPRHLRRVNIL